jgi:hypothetical protein
MSGLAAGPLHGPTDANREGHVSRARLLGEGGVLARRLQEQRQAQQQELGDAAAAEQQQQEQQPAQVTWPELWDARCAGLPDVQKRDKLLSLGSFCSSVAVAGTGC